MPDADAGNPEAWRTQVINSAYLGNAGHPRALLHEELDLGEGFWHSLRVHLPSLQRGTALLLGLTAEILSSSVALATHLLA